MWLHLSTVDSRNTKSRRRVKAPWNSVKNGFLPFWEVLNHWNHASSRTKARSRKDKISSLSSLLNFSALIPFIRSGKKKKKHLTLIRFWKPCYSFFPNLQACSKGEFKNYQSLTTRFLPCITKSSVGGLPLLGIWTTYPFGILLQKEIHLKSFWYTTKSNNDDSIYWS